MTTSVRTSVRSTRAHHGSSPTPSQVPELPTESIRLHLDRLNLGTTGNRSQLVRRLTQARHQPEHDSSRASRHLDGDQSGTEGDDERDSSRDDTTDDDTDDDGDDDVTRQGGDDDGDDDMRQGGSDARLVRASSAHTQRDPPDLDSSDSDPGDPDYAPPTTKHPHYTPLPRPPRLPRTATTAPPQAPTGPAATLANTRDARAAVPPVDARAASGVAPPRHLDGPVQPEVAAVHPALPPLVAAATAAAAAPPHLHPAPPPHPGAEAAAEAPAATRPSTGADTRSRSNDSARHHRSRGRRHHSRRRRHHHSSDSRRRHRSHHRGDKSLVTCVAPLPRHIKEKIVRGEYVSFCKLLPHTEAPPFAGTTAEDRRRRRSTTHPTIQDRNTRLEAWNQFLGARLSHDPSLALELVKYQTILTMLFKNYAAAACLQYDHLFRQAAARDTSIRWDTLKEDIFVWALTLPTHTPGNEHRQRASALS